MAFCQLRTLRRPRTPSSMYPAAASHVRQGPRKGTCLWASLSPTRLALSRIKCRWSAGEAFRSGSVLPRRLHSGSYHRGSCQPRLPAAALFSGRPFHPRELLCKRTASASRATAVHHPPDCSSCMRANFHPRQLGREIPAATVLRVGGPLEAAGAAPWTQGVASMQQILQAHVVSVLA